MLCALLIINLRPLVTKKRLNFQFEVLTQKYNYVFDKKMYEKWNSTIVNGNGILNFFHNVAATDNTISLRMGDHKRHSHFGSWVN